MIIVGSLSTFMSSSGFVAVKGSARKFSFYLLVATVFMLPFAIIFEGNRTYAAVLPIIFLAILQRYLSYIAKQKVTAQVIESYGHSDSSPLVAVHSLKWLKSLQSKPKEDN